VAKSNGEEKIEQTATSKPTFTLDGQLPRPSAGKERMDDDRAPGDKEIEELRATALPSAAQCPE
jgi:hypothetical protein